MAVQGTAVLVIERVWRVPIDILYVMDGPPRQSGEERAFRDAVGVEVGDNCHCLITMAIRPIYAAIYR